MAWITLTEQDVLTALAYAVAHERSRRVVRSGMADRRRQMALFETEGVAVRCTGTS